MYEAQDPLSIRSGEEREEGRLVDQEKVSSPSFLSVVPSLRLWTAFHLELDEDWLGVVLGWY